MGSEGLNLKYPELEGTHKDHQEAKLMRPQRYVITSCMRIHLSFLFTQIFKALLRMLSCWQDFENRCLEV